MAVFAISIFSPTVREGGESRVYIHVRRPRQSLMLMAMYLARILPWCMPPSYTEYKIDFLYPCKKVDEMRSFHKVLGTKSW